MSDVHLQYSHFKKNIYTYYYYYYSLIIIIILVTVAVSFAFLNKCIDKEASMIFFGE